jgi:hypothetical protein
MVAKPARPKQRRITELQILLFSYPATQKEHDDQALEWMSDTLDKGGNPGVRWPFTREKWSAILKRRIANDYGRENDARLVWRNRHFHVRQLAHQAETRRATAAAVARIWESTSAPATAVDTILRAAKGQGRKIALEWIDLQVQSARRHTNLPGQLEPQPIPDEAIIYAALERAVERIAAEYGPPKKSKIK